ncbi:FMN-binding negative transcriptional regulator [Mucilaginibacter sp.]|uniref:FMN-binding negative transcriptional regulator n=1 Tax=Mucilaginibacter sp. TaxID=1882438 RepID=UPI0035BC0119
MYIPKINQLTDRQRAIDFMRKYSFAAIVTVVDGRPTATHLPFVIEQRGDNIMLISHFAKANHQAADIFACTPLVIFTEPHAYISPTHYEKQQNVPTWNYIAVHAYGEAIPVEDAATVLEKTINFYEAEYLQQWNSLSSDFKVKMMNGIVAFEITVTDLQAKSKLSQNRSDTEQQNIISAFAKSGNYNEQQIAAYMQDF